MTGAAGKPGQARRVPCRPATRRAGRSGVSRFAVPQQPDRSALRAHRPHDASGSQMVTHLSVSCGDGEVRSVAACCWLSARPAASAASHASGAMVARARARTSSSISDCCIGMLDFCRMASAAPVWRAARRTSPSCAAFAAEHFQGGGQEPGVTAADDVVGHVGQLVAGLPGPVCPEVDPAMITGPGRHPACPPCFRPIASASCSTCVARSKLPASLSNWPRFVRAAASRMSLPISREMAALSSSRDREVSSSSR